LEQAFEIRTCEWTSEACHKGTPEKAGGWRSQTRFESRSGGSMPSPFPCEWTSEACHKGTTKKAGGWRSRVRQVPQRWKLGDPAASRLKTRWTATK
jgi:hypothetical protein